MAWPETEILNDPLVFTAGEDRSFTLEMDDENRTPVNWETTSTDIHVQVRKAPGGTVVVDLTETNGGIVLDGTVATLNFLNTLTDSVVEDVYEGDVRVENDTDGVGYLFTFTAVCRAPITVET